jgi:uncharacterized protein
MLNKSLNKVREALLSALENENVAIALFGSCAAGVNNESSDIDIAVIPKGSFKNWKLSILREKIENLNIPYVVDIVDFSIVSESFKKTALQNVVWWKI